MEKQQSVTKEVERLESGEREKKKKKYIITKFKCLGTTGLRLNLPKKPNAFQP